MMFKKLSFPLVLLLTTLLTACGWHFKNAERLPEDLQTLTFTSGDQYSDMSRALKTQLELSGATLVSAQDGVAVLRLSSVKDNSRVASVFKQAKEAEKILTVKAAATVTVPNKGTYPIDVTVHRTFFDDSRAALAKSAEKEKMRQDMYEQAARQLIVKMSALDRALSKQ